VRLNFFEGAENPHFAPLYVGEGPNCRREILEKTLVEPAASGSERKWASKVWLAGLPSAPWTKEWRRHLLVNMNSLPVLLATQRRKQFAASAAF
jgi:hypothetical protein